MGGVLLTVGATREAAGARTDAPGEERRVVSMHGATQSHESRHQATLGVA